MTASATTVLLLVVGARFLVPLLIPRFPLPAIVAALILDGIDQTVFQMFGFDPPGYQGYDKAMDVYYLAIAYLSTLRNWANGPAVQVARFLYFYRLIGVVAFELAQLRALLLIFPNTFEYFFIAYETYRLFWNPARVTLRRWIITAAVIWIFVKLPQEWWIHVAQLDFTDMVAEVPWFGPAVVAALILLGLVYWYAVRPRQPEPDWQWHVAADPLPRGAVTVADRNRWVAEHGRLLSTATLEKVTLIGLLWVIYAQVLPGTTATPIELFLGTSVIVLANAAVSLLVARSARGMERTLLAFGVRVLMNVGLMFVAERLLSADGRQFDSAAALFFVLLVSLLTLLDDRYRPIYEMRFATPSTRVP
ncbi:hypothetical protein FHR83_001677 [Actinoplanes campanulatus]|uniref:Uncharacterized protein n=1 Tax=Actinoplanes campanulatus TaxID=113559 RepID=A0A7W5FD30_9ACTN|nr:hypothetical protein [Actinoplanes campanulatus]MBB3094028.1 hypothetical protein [Actinoplanes campanulatus]GGN33206.1 hypothetical protein GCM10010109_55000 [Actinoplanes campanulatus]GID38275.1 hypothetical protein Aca09nite_47810 [Actinoplanes campanulatus]